MSEATPPRSSPRRRGLILAAAAIALAAGGFFLWRRHESGRAGSQGSPALTEAFQDWNADRSPLGGRHRALSSVPLLERLPDGTVLYRLANRVLFPADGMALVQLRESTYWSDVSLFRAAHVVDAVSRLRELHAAGKVALTAEEAAWLAWPVSAKGDHALEVKGFRDQAALERYLASDLLHPIRKDLLAKDAKTAWLTVLGPYRLPSPPASPLSPQDVLRYKPNPYFYGGAPKEDLAVPVKEFVGDATGRQADAATAREADAAAAGAPTRKAVAAGSATRKADATVAGAKAHEADAAAAGAKAR